MNNSNLLNRLLETAKQSDNSGSITTLNFMKAALEICCINQDQDNNSVYGDELLKTASKLNSLSMSPQQTYDLINAYINSNDYNSLMDSLAFDIMLNKVQKETESNGVSMLSSDAVIYYLLTNPSDELHKALSNKEISKNPSNKADQNKQQPKESENTAQTSKRKSKSSTETTDIISISDLTKKAGELRRELSKLVFGQDYAIQTMVTGYFQSEILSQMDKSHTGPRALFLFAGPPGVGKTFLAESAAHLLGLPYARFDMSDYSDDRAILNFSGSNSTFGGSGHGTVTGFVEKNPHSVLLFDEIEKAHPNIIRLFLQILDAGRLQDTYTDIEIPFKDTIIIFTTNAGKSLYQDNDYDNYADIPQKVILKALEEDIDERTRKPIFPPELCSRFSTGHVIMFNHINAHHLRDIAKNEILQQIEAFKDTFHVSITIDESVYSAILFSEGSSADARTIQSKSNTFLQNELYELFRLADSDKNTFSSNDIKNIHFTISLPSDDSIKKLFISDKKEDLLVFANDDIVQKCVEYSSSYKIIGAQTCEKATDIMSEKDIQLVLIDPTYGKRDSKIEYLNIEDMDSEARDFLAFVREKYRETPVYLLNTESYSLEEEELVSFQKSGVFGTMNLSSEEFPRILQEFSERLHQQHSMKALARENKVLTYQTGQTLSDNGTDAVITLFDFVLKTAVDPDESENILSNVSKPDIHFDQIIGADNAKIELQYFVRYLKDPKKYQQYGGHVPRGVILYGPPGTGKTTLAKAMACESNATFLTANSNEFFSKYYGEGPRKIRELFQIARKYAPSILFVDEIDIIARKRTGSEFGHQEEELLSTFLTELDGFKSDPSRPVFVLTATNCDLSSGSNENFDPALLRRFDRHILVDLPTKENRIQYLNMKINENSFFSISQDMINNIAVRSTGMSIADLESVIDMAIRLAIRSGSNVVMDDMLLNAFETQTYGDERPWDMADLERVARHEAGHAYIYWKEGGTPSYITIIARGNHGGGTQFENNEDKQIYTKNELLAQIRTELGGRATEIVYYGEEDGLSTGASGDLENATQIAKKILCNYGMDNEFGLYVINNNRESEDPIIRDAVNSLLSSEMSKTIQMIQEGREIIDKIVNVLMDNNHLTSEELLALLSS